MDISEVPEKVSEMVLDAKQNLLDQLVACDLIGNGVVGLALMRQDLNHVEEQISEVRQALAKADLKLGDAHEILNSYQSILSSVEDSRPADNDGDFAPSKANNEENDDC
tara:strand:- start:999 stop:1325 length:327 start_codon:yes stop_codon:yes gene_type:complete